VGISESVGVVWVGGGCVRVGWRGVWCGELVGDLWSSSSCWPVVAGVGATKGVREVGSVFEQLEREWCRLGGDRMAARRLGDVCLLAGRARSLVEVERFVRGASPGEADGVLLGLVNRAVVGDGLAARVLLQLLLPGTRGLARRWWALGDRDERAAAAVMAVYQRICSYPVQRRPAKVAANILMDAAQELRRAVPRVVAVPSADPAVCFAPERDEVISNPAVELAEVLQDAVRDGIVDADDAALIARSRIAGDRMADLAAHRGLRPRTVWDRRQRAEHALVTARLNRAAG
jgi:hypothetical protein